MTSQPLLLLHASPPATSDSVDLDRTLGAARDGSPDALSELFRQYATLVHRVAFRLTRSADDAEDVLQDVFVRLPESLRRYEARSSFERWLTSVTMRAALSRMRTARARSEESLADNDSHASPLDEPLERIALADALARLPVDARTILVLRAEGHSHAEIGDLLSIKAGTSEVRLFRAREALRALLGGAR